MVSVEPIQAKRTNIEKIFWEYNMALKNLLCRQCSWYYEPFEGQTCRQRFDVNEKSSACDEFSHNFKQWMILKKQQIPQDRPVFAAIIKLYEAGVKPLDQLVVATLETRWHRPSNGKDGWRPYMGTGRVPNSRVFTVGCSFQGTQTEIFDIGLIKNQRLLGLSVTLRQLHCQGRPIMFDQHGAPWYLYDPTIRLWQNPPV